LSECLHAWGGTAEAQTDPHALTRELGIKRAYQQVLVADSIRAGTLLWRAAVPILREIANSDGQTGREQFPDLLEALHEAILDRLYVGSIAYEHARLTEETRVPDGGVRRLPKRDVTEAVSRPESLTSREWDVLKCISRALSNRDIARELGLGESTVKTHLRKAFRKLGATSRVDAINKVGLAGSSLVKLVHPAWPRSFTLLRRLPE